MSPKLWSGKNHVEFGGSVVHDAQTGDLFVESPRTSKMIASFLDGIVTNDRIFFTAEGDSRGKAFVLHSGVRPIHTGKIQGHIASMDVKVMERNLGRQLNKIH